MFQVFCVENNNKASQINLFRSRGQRRHVFIYDNYVLFVKAISEKAHQVPDRLREYWLRETQLRQVQQRETQLRKYPLAVNFINFKI